MENNSQKEQEILMNEGVMDPLIAEKFPAWTVSEIGGGDEFPENWEIFKNCYPSLKGVAWGDILGAASGHPEALEACLAAASCGGVWPAVFSLHSEGNLAILKISPYVGDRHYHVVFEDGVAVQWTADYNARPSRANAGGHIMSDGWTRCRLKYLVFGEYLDAGEIRERRCLLTD